MSEQPALKVDAVASLIVTVRDLVKAERERDVARAERDEALAEVERGKRHCDEAVKLWRDLYHEAIGIPPSEHQARRMEKIAATSERVAAERDQALRLHVEDHARIDALLAELDEALATRARVRALAEKWRYKGEFGWGAWQEGHGPDQEGWVLDHAAGEIRTALDGPS